MSRWGVRTRIGALAAAGVALVSAPLAWAAATPTAAPAAGTSTATTATTTATSATAGALPALSISQQYVTGISSGGYMATQLQVAYSQRFAGAGVFSAGPYYCAQDSLTIALTACTDDSVPTDVSALQAKTREYAAAGLIDPVANLTKQRTWLFHGTQDTTVKQPVADALASWYRGFGVPLTYRNTVAAGHAWISPLGPGACGQTASPYINHCGIGAPQDMLRTMFGAVNAPNTGTARGRLVSFSQDPYAVAAKPGAGDVTRTGAAAIGMGSTGFAYVPSSCAQGATCKLVVALHGCLQTYDQIGTTFVRKAYLDQYADTNRFVVLYPQATPDPSFGNPKGCWDWWGYLGAQDDRYATKVGPQMATVMRMVEQLRR